MRKLVFIVVLGCLVVACSHRDEAEVAARTAKLFHEQLFDGQYEAFVDGHFHADSLPADYREELIANAKMFVGQQQTEHRGIKEVRISASKLSEKEDAANVFLVYCYGDSTSEEVCVPMVKREDTWLMK